MPSGMLLFDKPSGWTSHDVVAALRRGLARGSKVGHCGTLDPLATGLLILLVGPCTRLQGKLQGLDKVYSGLIRLGVRTDTGDAAGKVLEERPVPELTLARLQRALDGHKGVFESAAPAYSAVKHQGVPLYEYARRGEAVPVKPRSCGVYDWKAVSYAAPDLSHRLSCSSGTYVRSLAESLGERLGCGARVETLRRESIGLFGVEGAMTLEELKSASGVALQARIEAGMTRLLAGAAG